MIDLLRRPGRRHREGRHHAARRLPLRAQAKAAWRRAPTARTEVEERHRHRYEFNNRYAAQLQSRGLVLSGKCVGRELVEIIELPDHPWFLAVQFHPELKSRPHEPHPLFVDFVRAALERRWREPATTRSPAKRRPTTSRRQTRPSLRPNPAKDAPRSRSERRETVRHRGGASRRSGVLVIAGPCVIESAEMCLEIARKAAVTPARRAACRSCSRRRTARPTVRAAASFEGLPVAEGARDPGAREARDRRPDPHRRARDRRGRGGRRGRRLPADPGVPLPADRAAPGRGAQPGAR